MPRAFSLLPLERAYGSIGIVQVMVMLDEATSVRLPVARRPDGPNGRGPARAR
jgi:hypothetical protein